MDPCLNADNAENHEHRVINSTSESRNVVFRDRQVSLLFSDSLV